MKQTFWILVIWFAGNLLWLHVFGACPYAVQNCYCTESSVVCSQLTVIPPLTSNNTDGSIKELTFLSGNLDIIQANSLPSNLRNLTFSDVNITDISPDALRNSSATLMSVNMRKVNYHELPEALLKVTHLTTLVVSEAKFKNWNSTVLQHVGKTVTSLVVDNNGFQFLPDWFQYFSMVNYVSMSGGDFRELSFDEFRNIRNLTFLKISRHQISAFICTEDVAMYSTLETLDASSNHFQVFPKCVNRMSKLKVLYLNKNVILELTSDAIPVQLKELHINYNDVYTLSDSSFPNSSSLEILNCIFCDIINISSLAFQPLDHLRELHLEHNQLESVPVALSQLTRLELVSMQYTSTLGCQYPIDKDLSDWIKGMNSTKVYGSCGNLNMNVGCYLVNDKQSPRCSRGSRLGFSVILFCACSLPFVFNMFLNMFINTLYLLYTL